VAQLLALMDGLVSRGEVVIIGATNMPELVDPALAAPDLRPRNSDRRAKRAASLQDPESIQFSRKYCRSRKDVDWSIWPRLPTDTSARTSPPSAPRRAWRRFGASCPRSSSRWMPSPPRGRGEAQVTADDFVSAFKAVEPTSTREFMSERPNISFRMWEDCAGSRRTFFPDAASPPGISPLRHSRLSPPRGVSSRVRPERGKP